MRYTWICALALATSCVETNTKTCGENVCPASYTCDGSRCVDPAARAACADLADSKTCAVRGLPGVCVAGECEVTFCGNGTHEAGEECDGDDLGGQTCESQNYYGQVAPLACKADCTFDTSGCVGACGDGIKNGDELCDGDDVGAATCKDAGYYDAPGLKCSPFCTYDVLGCTGTCGDLMTNGGELCDGSGPGETCIDAGFDVGRLECNTACSYAFDGCGRIGWHFLANAVATKSEYHVHASSRTDVWGVSNGGQALHFNGAQWTKMSIGFADLESVWTAGAANAWASDASGVLWHWNGMTWAHDAGTNLPTGVHAVWGTSATNVWIVTASAGVHRWNGTTWAPVGSVTETNLDLIHGSSASDVWISNGSIVRHWNGTAWSAATNVGASTSVTSLLALGPSDAWAVGNDGSQSIHSHWNGTSWTKTTSQFNTSSYVSVTGSATNDVWVSGPTNNMGISTVEHWDGYTWLTVESPALLQLFELDPGTIYGATKTAIDELAGLVYATNDPGSSNIFASVALFSTTDGFIFLTGSNLANGAGWFDRMYWGSAAIAPSTNLTAAWGITGTDTWIATNVGTPYHFNGSSFSPGTFTPPENFPPVPSSNMWGSSTTDIWYAGTISSTSQGVVRHFNGSTWSPRDIAALPANVSIIRISGSGPNDVWALTATNRLFHWTGTWSEVTNVPQPIEDMVVAGPNDVIITGGNTAHHGSAAGWTADTLPNVSSTPIHLVALAPDFVFGASTTDVFHYDGVRWSLIAEPIMPNNSPIFGLGLAPGRLDIGYTPGNTNATAVRSLVITRPWRCAMTEAGRCTDAVDNDCDGLIDTRDSDCP